jgi:hypothetical protein
MHPKIFSDLSSAQSLYLTGNICIDRDFVTWPFPSKETIEEALAECGAGYKLHLDPSSGRTPLEIFEEKITKLIEQNQEKINGKFAELEKKFDGRSEENAKEIREIKRLVEKVIEMMTNELKN